jgi:hydrogenase nickel incorporation protein HypA/HybF
MHELAVMESLLRIVVQHAENAGATAVTDLHIVMGELSSIVDDSVQFYWDIISQNTIAENARLHFRRIPAEFVCLDCDNRYRPEGDNFVCPVCGSVRVKLAAGDEFYLEAIDVRN